MELIKAKTLAINLMEEHGLIEKGWYFEFDHAKRRFGRCSHGRKLISLSRTLVELNGIERVKNTILHELAHALVGPRNGHNEIWRAKALEIGCDGERCYSADDVEIPSMRYQAKCGGCGVVHQKSRMTAKALRPTFKTACNCQNHKPWSDKILLNYIDTKL